MPVFSRTKMVMQEDCFRDKPERLNIKYVGPNPMALYYKVYEMIQSIFRAAESDILEERYNWGKGDKEKFSVRWYLHKDMDMFTYLWIRVDVSGTGDEKSGTASIVIKPVLRTEYPQDTIWQRSLFYEMVRTFWHRGFYHRRRDAYAEDCRTMCTMFAKQMNEFFRTLKEAS